MTGFQALNLTANGFPPTCTSHPNAHVDADPRTGPDLDVNADPDALRNTNRSADGQAVINSLAIRKSLCRCRPSGATVSHTHNAERRHGGAGPGASPSGAGV